MSKQLPRITSLAIYPLKSAAGIEHSSLEIGVLGPQWDRRWMLVDVQGRFISQRQYPAMCRIQTAISDEVLRFSVAGVASLSVAVATVKATVAPRSVQVWQDTVQAEDCGDEAAQWFSDYLGTACRLVMMPESCRRAVDKDYAVGDDLVSFADGFPVLLLSEASVDDLNQRLSNPVHHRRFRPNIVVSGVEAFAEDGWQRLRMGEVEFSVVKPCSRCVIPSIDPDTALKQPEVTRTLASYRRRDGAVYFGQNLIPHGKGQIRLGDQLEILA